MKVFKVLLLTIVVAGIACAVRAQEARNRFVVHPYAIPYKARGDLAAPRFWTPSTIMLVTLDGAAKAVDSYATRKNIAGGGLEYNPLARPFVHSTGVQVTSMAAMLGAEIAAAYLLHRRRHDKTARAVLAAGIITNGLGAACSITHRVANW